VWCWGGGVLRSFWGEWWEVWVMGMGWRVLDGGDWLGNVSDVEIFVSVECVGGGEWWMRPRRVADHKSM